MKILSLSATRRIVSIAILASFVVSNAFAVNAVRGVAATVVSSPSATAKYTTDLTQLGREGRLRETLSFDKETSRLVKVLAEGGVRQPVLIDEDKGVQNTIVEQAALRIAKGSVPTGLAGRSIIKLETAALFSNAHSQEQLVQAVNSIVSDAVASKGQTILFVDELTNLVGAGAAKTKFFNAIAEGNLVVIGGSSAAAYDERIESQPEVAAHFEGIRVAGRSNIAQSDDKGSNDNKDGGYSGDNISPDLRVMMSQDPSGQKRIKVIIQAKNADNASFRALLASGQANVSDRIGSSDTLVAELPLAALNTLSTSGMINYISPDRPTASTGHVEDTTGTTGMRTQGGVLGLGGWTLNGSGVGVAVVDSGIYAAHNGFKNGTTSRIVANVNFTSPSPNDTGDGYGHGTHVAGLAVGSDGINSGAYRGVAPGASIISVKALSSNGVGQTSWLLNGLDWILANRTAYNIKVVNLSLGSTAIDSYKNDPVCVKVKALVNAGIVVVAAAGNEGKTASGQKLYGGIHSPGDSPYVITVGASNSFGTTTHADDSIASYSSHGPTRGYFTTSTGYRVYDNLIKPDLVAPGNKLVSYKAANNALAASTPGLALDSTNGADSMMYLSGTSMSAPLVAGAAAA
ncbi:MAG: S8 family serine peptidase, partial [Acidobacteriota bacterium]